MIELNQAEVALKGSFLKRICILQGNDGGQSDSPSASTANTASGSNPSRFGPFQRQHQTRLYTAVLEVDSQQAQSVPMPVDLVSAADTSSSEHSRGAVQAPAALQLESRQQPPGNTGMLHWQKCVKESLLTRCWQLTLLAAVSIVKGLCDCWLHCS